MDMWVPGGGTPPVGVPLLYIPVPDHLPTTGYTSNRVVQHGGLRGGADTEGIDSQDRQTGQRCGSVPDTVFGPIREIVDGRREPA